MPSPQVSFFLVKDGVAKNIRILSRKSTAYGICASGRLIRRDSSVARKKYVVVVLSGKGSPFKAARPKLEE
jgi:hypothetical protein